jgi:phage tail-like protein
MADSPLDGELLSLLPTPFRVDQATADFLEAFEAILLSGTHSPSDRLLGIEQVIDKLATYFISGQRGQPQQPQTPEEFLPWLAGWLAFNTRADLPETTRRDFIHNLSTLYRGRGTQENLKRVLEYFTGLPSTDSSVTVSETEPHCFEVRVDLSALIAGQTLSDVPRLMEIAHALIRREKPAHTRYVLAPNFPSFRIGELNPDGTIKTPFSAVVHGHVPDPNDSTKTIEVGNTLLGSNMWEM